MCVCARAHARMLQNGSPHACMRAGRHLLKLDISDNPMTAEVAESLAQLIKQQPLLRHLNLNDTSLTNDGAEVREWPRMRLWVVASGCLRCLNAVRLG